MLLLHNNQCRVLNVPQWGIKPKAPFPVVKKRSGVNAYSMAHTLVLQVQLANFWFSTH